MKLVKKINFKYKESLSSWPIEDDNIIDKDNDINKDTQEKISEILEKWISQEEKLNMLDDLKEISEEKISEVKDFLDEQINPFLESLQQNIFENMDLQDIYDKIEEIKKKLETITNPSEKRICKTQITLLKQASESRIEDAPA